MACCYIAAFCVGQLVKACQFLDLDEGIRYNDDESFSVTDEKSAFKQTPISDQSSLLISLEGLTCSACTVAVESALSKLSGVSKVRVSLALQQAIVISDGAALDGDLMLQEIRDAGYEGTIGGRTPEQFVELLQAKDHVAQLSSYFTQLARGVAVLQSLTWTTSFVKGTSSVGWLLLLFIHLVSMAVSIYIQCSYISWLHIDGWKWVRGGSVNMNTLISLSMGLGTLLSATDLIFRGPRNSTSYYSTTIGLALVVVAGRYIDVLSRRSGLKYLINLYKPMMETQYATLHPSREIVPSDYLRPSDEIIVEPFREIPCDCYVIQGTSFVNQAIVTGESLPIKKNVGDTLLGGTRNQNGHLICLVQKAKEDSFYTQLVQLSTKSASTDSAGYDWIEVAIRYFVSGVITLSLIVPMLRILHLWRTIPFYDMFRLYIFRVVTVLMSVCPCALGLAIPSAVVAIVSSAGRRGILFHGGLETIQKLQNSKTIVFDKTGTLTEAILTVDNMIVTHEWADSKEILWQFVCAVEESATASHPVARAIFSSGIRELGLLWLKNHKYRKTQRLKNDIGRGVSGQVCLEDGVWHHVKVGSLRYMEQSGISSLPPSARQGIAGMIAVHIAVNSKYSSTLYLGDIVRSQAVDVVKDLVSSGYECHMLTGDTSKAAHRVSNILNIPLLGSEATPSDKQDNVESLKSKRKVVTMVGDGLNDSLGLAAADVGIALHRDSTYTVTGAAIMILNSQLESVPLLFQMAKMTMRQIHLNLLWIFIYNVVAMSLASGIVTPFGFELSPPIAALMMSMSSVFMSLQSYRLQHRMEAL